MARRIRQREHAGGLAQDRVEITKVHVQPCRDSTLRHGLRHHDGLGSASGRVLPGRARHQGESARFQHLSPTLLVEQWTVGAIRRPPAVRQTEDEVKPRRARREFLKQDLSARRQRSPHLLQTAVRGVESVKHVGGDDQVDRSLGDALFREGPRRIQNARGKGLVGRVPLGERR